MIFAIEIQEYCSGEKYLELQRKYPNFVMLSLYGRKGLSLNN